MNRPEHPGNRLTWVRAALALLAGAAQALSMAWPWTTPWPRLMPHQGQAVWWLQLLALAVLAGLLQAGRNWRLAALLGWLFGLSWMIGSVGWTFVALHTYGGLPFALAALAVLALASLLALFYGGAAALFAVLTPASKVLVALVFAAAWLLAELARGSWLTGFAWAASGYAHTDGPLAPFAAWLGVYGLCALSAWLAISLVHVLDPWPGPSWRQRLGTLSTVLVIGSVAWYLQVQTPDHSRPNGDMTVTLMQGNIPQDEKFETGSGVPQALQWYAEQLQSSRTALVVAPETAVPVLPQQLPPAYWAALQQRFGDTQQAALIGTPLGNSQQGYTNSVLGLKPGQTQPWRYDKQHLVPFGEFIPPFFKWFTEMLNIPLGDFNRGGSQQPPFEWQGQRVAANICYEDLFGEELAPQFINPDLAPTLFVNISNLAWFGKTLAINQHLQIARMRALEFERAFVLATNTGATAIVDHRGRVVSSLSQNTRAVLAGSVEGRTGVTPYAWWVARFGLWPLWLLALALLLPALRERLRKRPPAALTANQTDVPEAP
jgi:apolipoprotein N-acyltransferase